MKRKVSVVLAVLMMFTFCWTAYADVPKVSGDLFSCLKKALSYLASGEYERLVTLLPFNDVAPSASEWQSFAEGNFSTLGNGVQTEYAVAYWTGSSWRLAIPVSEPKNGNVETLVLTSSDGETFSGYRYANWSQVQSEYESASHVKWNKEYVSSSPVVEAD